MKIEIKNVSKEFKNITVLNNINLVLEEGNIYGLYGRNGAGKSVLLKLICGFYIPTSGEILYDGQNLNFKKEFPKDLRALIEKPSFFPELTGYENLKLLAKIQNKINDNDIIKALEIVNLKNEMNKKYSKYSLGMKQKLGIAQAIMENPKIIILDEPFNGIEQKTVEKLINYLNSIKDDRLIIISSHIKEDLKKLSNHIYIVDDGKVYEDF